MDNAPVEWSDLPAETLTSCIGNGAANTAASLINSAARCPSLVAYDLRWRRHAGHRSDTAGPGVKLSHPLLCNGNDPPVPEWPGLGVVFTKHQRRSLSWMLRKEAGTDDELVVERGCQDQRFSTHRGVDFQVRLSFTLRGGILADTMGYGKTLLAVAVTAASCTLPLPCGRNGKPPCGATLVFMPENLVCQWLTEFKKALGTAVEVRFFGAEAHGVDDPRNMDGSIQAENSEQVEDSEPQSSSDVPASTPSPPIGADRPSVIGHSSSESVHGGSKAHVYAVASIDGWMEMMRAPWEEALALLIPYSLLHAVEPWFTLHRCHWRRVVVDELHEALACQTLADALGLISAQHVWGLSGTLPVTTAGDVARLAGLFGVSLPMDATNARRFIDCYVRRNTSSPADEIAVEEEFAVVRPAPMERAIYLACQHDFDQPTVSPEAHEGYLPPFLSTWRGLQEHGREAALVKLCCHHQVTATDIEILSTPEQSVERLRIWKRHHCQEAKRLIGQRALLAEWMKRNSRLEGSAAVTGPDVLLPESSPAGTCGEEAWAHAKAEVDSAASLDDAALLEACGDELESTTFAICLQPEEAEARWLAWCEAAKLEPGTRGGISRLRKIMYDELWGRLVDGKEGWAALAKMGPRNWRADYAAAEKSKLLEALDDYASSLRSYRFLESVVQQAALPNLECIICMQPMVDPRITPCAHIFCAACIERSIETKLACPQCRTHIRGRGQLSAFVADSIVVAPDPANFGGEYGSKITALVERLEAIQHSGEKAVVFAQWQDLIFKIHAALRKSGMNAAVLAGGAFDRASVLQRFESPELPILLLSLEDSASGTNMSHANHVMLVHPMVAASAEEQTAYEAQAIGRVCRWGQKRTVHVWRFVMESTIEADLAARHVA